MIESPARRDAPARQACLAQPRHVAAADDPVLEPGDVLTVDTVTRQPFYWRDALPIVSAVASVGIAIGYFVR